MAGTEIFGKEEIMAAADVIERRMIHRYGSHAERAGVYRAEEFEAAAFQFSLQPLRVVGLDPLDGQYAPDDAVRLLFGESESEVAPAVGFPGQMEAREAGFLES